MKVIPNDCELWWLYFKNENRQNLHCIQSAEFSVEEGCDDKKINSKEILKALGNVTSLRVVDQNEYSSNSFFQGLYDEQAGIIKTFRYENRVFDTYDNRLMLNFQNLERLYLEPVTFLEIPNLTSWKSLKYIMMSTQREVEKNQPSDFFDWFGFKIERPEEFHYHESHKSAP